MSKPSVSPLLKKVKVKSPKNFFTKSINKQSKKKPRQSDSSSSCSAPTSPNNVNEYNKLSSTTSTTVASNKSEHHTPIQSNTTTKELHRNHNDDFPTVPNLLDQHDNDEDEDDSVAAMSDIRERENSLDQNSWSEMYTNSEYDAYYKLDSIDADVDVEISIGVDEIEREIDEIDQSKTDDDNDTNDDMFIGDIDEEVEGVSDGGDDGGIVEDDSIQWNTPKRGNKSISATDNTIPSSPPTSSSLNHNTPTNTPRSKVFFQDDDDDTSFNLKTPPNLKVCTTPNNTTAANFHIPTTPMTPLEELHTPGGSTNAPKVLSQNKKLRAGRKELLKVIDATAKQFKAYEEVASKKIFELEERIREMEKERCIDDEKVESNVAADNVGDNDKAAAADTVQDSNETDEKLISSLKLQCETLEYRLNEKEAELEQKRQVWENDVEKLSDALMKNNDALDYSVTELERLRKWKIELDLRDKGSDAVSESRECNDEETSLVEEQEKAKEDTNTEFDNESVTDQETDEASAISEPTQQIELEESTKDDVNEEEVISDDSANDQEEKEEEEEELVKVAEDEGGKTFIIDNDAQMEEEKDRGSELECKSAAAGKEREDLLAEKDYQIDSLEENLKEKGDEIVQLQRDLDSCFKEIETLKAVVHETATAKGQDDFQRIIENMQYEAIKYENNATASRERLESELEEKSAEIAQLNEEIRNMCVKQDEAVVDLPVSETDNSDHAEGNNRVEPIDNIRSSLLLATTNTSSPPSSSQGISPTGARRWSTFARKLAKEGRQYAAAVGNANDPESMLGMIRQRDRHISSLEAVIESNTLMIEKLKNDIERIDTEHEEALAQSSKSMRQLEEENEVYLQQVKGFEKAFMTLNESQQTTILPSLDEDVTNTPEGCRPDIRADEVGSDEVTSNLQSQNRKLERVLAETREENSFQEDIIEKLKTELTTLRVVSQQEKESACDKLRDENKVIEAQKSALEHQLLEINKFARNSLAQDNTSTSNDAGSNQANDIDKAGSNPILVAKVAMLENAKKVLESSVDSLRNDQQEKLAPLLERIALLEEEKRIIEEEMATKLQCREQTISNLEESLKQATQSRLANKKKSSALQQSVRLLARASKATSDSGE